MKKSFCYTIIMVLCIVLPNILMAQRNLTGIWRLNDTKKIKGPNYINAIPVRLTIEQKADVITFEIITDLGNRDTLVNESLMYGESRINESLTSTGKKKVISLQMNKDSSWMKQTEIFSKEDPLKTQSVSKEMFRISPRGTNLTLRRDYDGNDDSNGTQDFIVEGNYERVTAEQLAKEIATGKGVNFIEGLNWEQIKAKAKKEKKYIFVDCYATWCAPCKVMDRYVYPLDIVGEAMNDQFIAVKVQMDSTKNDPASVKLLYPLARRLEREYHITGLPSYLFFSSAGLPIHKAVGRHDAKKFIELLSKAIKPEEQLYTLFNNAKNKEFSWAEYPALIKRMEVNFREAELSKEIAEIYIREYLNSLNENDLLTKVNLDFINKYRDLIKSSDKIFQLALHKPALVNRVKESKDGWAEFLVERTIIRENVEPLYKKSLKLDKEPNWILLQQQLSRKYNKDLATTYVLDGRVEWYKMKKDWPSYFKYLRPQVARHDLKKLDEEHQDRLHFAVWYVFKYTQDIILMNQALVWIDNLIEVFPKPYLSSPMDTKACLLYKIGRKEEGIDLMKKIIEMFPEQRQSFDPRLESMLKGEKIWLTY